MTGGIDASTLAMESSDSMADPKIARAIPPVTTTAPGGLSAGPMAGS